jgi:hypothetical protein
MTGGATDGHGDRRVLVRSVRRAVRPRVGAAPVASSAGSAAVAEVDGSVQMQRTLGPSRAVGIRLAVAGGARSRKMVRGRRRMAIAAAHLAPFVPGGPFSRPAAVVARDRALPRGAIVARLGPHDGGVERDLDRAVAVRTADDLGPRHGVARGTDERLAPCGGRVDVCGVRTGLRGVVGKEAWIARRKRARLLTVARPARERALRFGVAARARRRTRRRDGDARRPRGSSLVTSPARFGVAGVEHGSPALLAKGSAVPRGRPRVGDPGRVRRSHECRRASTDPGLERRALGGVEPIGVTRRIERAQDRRAVVGGQRGRHGASDASDRVEVRSRSPVPLGRCFSMTLDASAGKQWSDVRPVDGRDLGRALLRARPERQ